MSMDVLINELLSEPAQESFLDIFMKKDRKNLKIINNIKKSNKYLLSSTTENIHTLIKSYEKNIDSEYISPMSLKDLSPLYTIYINNLIAIMKTIDNCFNNISATNILQIKELMDRIDVEAYQIRKLAYMGEIPSIFKIYKVKNLDSLPYNEYEIAWDDYSTNPIYYDKKIFSDNLKNIKLISRAIENNIISFEKNNLYTNISSMNISLYDKLFRYIFDFLNDINNLVLVYMFQYNGGGAGIY